MGLVKNLILTITSPLRLLLGGVSGQILKKMYHRNKSLKHDIHSDFRAKLLNPFHQVFVGKIPQPFQIYNNKIQFYSDGSLMSVQAYYVGEIEHHLISYLTKNFILDGLIFLDIGGHHGAFSVIAAY